MFSFSKKECESLALQMVGMDLTSEDEKKLIEGVFSSAKDLLAEADARQGPLTCFVALRLKFVEC